MHAMRHAMNRWMNEFIADQTPGEREMLLAVDVEAGDEAYEIIGISPGFGSR